MEEEEEEEDLRILYYKVTFNKSPKKIIYFALYIA